MKKYPMITKSPLRMSRFPVGVRRIVVKNTRINNMGVAEKRNCPAPFLRNYHQLKFPIEDVNMPCGYNSIKIYFLKITKILGLIPPYPPPTPYRNKCNSPLPFSRKSTMTLLLRDISLSSSKYFDICVYSAFCFLSQKKYWIHKE